MWAEMSDAAKWLAVGAAIVAAIIELGRRTRCGSF